MKRIVLAAAFVCALGLGVAFALHSRRDDGSTASTVTVSTVSVPKKRAWRPIAHDILYVPRGAALRSRPGGRIVRRVAPRTEFGSPQTLLATGPERGPWVAVRHTSLGDDKVAWLDRRRVRLRLATRVVRIEVDLSKRRLVVQGGEAERRVISVAIGAPDTPTPSGESYITDKLRGSDFGPYYGCCILALSGHQPNLPESWSGGDRLAIHGSPSPTWGQDVSNGCLHARERDLRWLMKHVPLGTPVLIHP